MPIQEASRLHRGHFAFMRALVQGLDERDSWARYLNSEGQAADARVVRRTVAWIRDALAAAAKREQRPGTARLILLDPSRISLRTSVPSLAEFAQAAGMEDFSEDEQLEAYLSAYPAAGRSGSSPAGRRARVIIRQIEALRWLEDLVVQDPRIDDAVAAWLNPAIAQRLAQAGIGTLRLLAERINIGGPRWWAPVHGVGATKAARVVAWMRANERVLGVTIAEFDTTAPSKAGGLQHAARPQGAPVPLEMFQTPDELDGRLGRHRAPVQECTLDARTDLEAIICWLRARGDADAPAGQLPKQLSATQRSYRKEAERLLLWAVLVQRQALSSLTREEAVAYRAFLLDPPKTWCGQRHHQRWSPMWRPLEGALKPAALRQALAIVRSLFAFLVRHRYVNANPFEAIEMPAGSHQLQGVTRTLSSHQWAHLEASLGRSRDTESSRRLHRAARWLYATGLRIGEITAAKCEDLRPVAYPDEQGRQVHGWLLAVSGRGGHRREVPVPQELVRELEQELARHGFDARVDVAGNRAVGILARFSSADPLPRAWSASGLYKALKAFLRQVAVGLETHEAGQLQKASAHWLRHAHGAHAAQGRAGRAQIPLAVIRNNLGHAAKGNGLAHSGDLVALNLRAMRTFWDEMARVPQRMPTTTSAEP